MKRKGFTLIELLAVLVILVVIALITVPIIYRMIFHAKDKLSIENVRGYITAAETAIAKYGFESDEDVSGVYDITSTGVKKQDTGLELVVRVKGNRPTSGTLTFDEDANVIDVNIPISSKESIVMNDDGNLKKVDSNNPDVPGESDDSWDGVTNRPKMLASMIPIKYDGKKWIYADINETWYNYESKEWANAVVLNKDVTKNVGDTIAESEIALWYVWVPRFKYQLFNVTSNGIEEQEIQVEFENGKSTTGTVRCVDIDFKTNPTSNVSENCENAEVGNWYTHPAFTLGTQELTGIWVGKFEISTTDDTCSTISSEDNSAHVAACNKILPVAIRPNVSSWRNSDTSNFYYSIKNIADEYSITNGDSHMIKNMEWGAVAYLKQSKYGLGATDITINSSTTYLAGKGNYKTNVGGSTTGNITGIYDMSGGSWEYTMTNMVDSTGSFYASKSGFTEAIDPKYYDSYSYDESSEYSYERGKLGDATKETLKNMTDFLSGWYNDYAYFPFSDSAWLRRGGDYYSSDFAGIFGFCGHNGAVKSYGSTRAVLTYN